MFLCQLMLLPLHQREMKVFLCLFPIMPLSVELPIAAAAVPEATWWSVNCSIPASQNLETEKPVDAFGEKLKVFA